MIRKIWKNKWLILNGLWNIFSGKKQDIATQRQSICKRCSHYDKFGKSDMAVIKGQPACDICGCNIAILTASMEASCSLEDIYEVPKWTKHEEK